MFHALALHVASDVPGRINVSFRRVFAVNRLDPIGVHKFRAPSSHWGHKEMDMPNRSPVLYEFFVMHALRTLNAELRRLFYRLIFDFVDSHATYEHSFCLPGRRMRRKVAYAIGAMRVRHVTKYQLPEVYEKKLVFPRELDFPQIFFSTYGFSKVHLGYEVRLKNGKCAVWLQSKTEWKYNRRRSVHEDKTRVLYFDAQSYIDAE